MAKHSASILELAKKGATHRYQELKDELAALAKAFPHLRSATRIDVSSEPVAVMALSRQRRGKLSAAGRKAIAAAQRARWAKIKAGKSAAGGRKRKGMSPANRKATSERMKKYWAAKRRTAK